MTVVNINTERLLDKIRTFLNDPQGGTVNQMNLQSMRTLISEMIALRFWSDEKVCDVTAEVYDGSRERVRIIRMPHPHMIRNPHGVDGASLAEAMESIELMVLTTSDAVRCIAAEVAHQETDREARARHVARCETVRRWGEGLADDMPRLSRMLILFATDGTVPTMLTEEESRALGFEHEFAIDLLTPENADDLTSHLIEMAKEKQSQF